MEGIAPKGGTALKKKNTTENPSNKVKSSKSKSRERKK
jgi:hypothetical protein